MDDISPDKIIDEVMCCFSGIPSMAAVTDELGRMRKQPGQNLHVYINKWKDFHWWCTKKLPCNKDYKLTLSMFCSSLQTLLAENCQRNYGMRESGKSFCHFKTVLMR